MIMNQLMDKTLADNVTNYFFDYEGYLFVNNKKLLLKKPNLINTKCIDTCKVFENFKPQEIKQFISIAIFLEKNFIYGTYKYIYYRYDYRPINGEDDDDRDIVYLENGFDEIKQIRNSKAYLLDSKLKLYLLGFHK